MSFPEKASLQVDPQHAGVTPREIAAGIVGTRVVDAVDAVVDNVRGWTPPDLESVKM